MSTNRKGLIEPFALASYTFVILGSLVIDFLGGVAMTLIINNVESDTAVYAYGDSFLLHECSSGVRVTDIINTYFENGNYDPRSHITLSADGDGIQVSLHECAESFFGPYMTHIPQTQSRPLVRSYGITVLSSHCPSGLSCLSLGDTQSNFFQDIPFYTPFHDFALLRVYVS